MKVQPEFIFTLDERVPSLRRFSCLFSFSRSPRNMPLFLTIFYLSSPLVDNNFRGTDHTVPSIDDFAGSLNTGHFMMIVMSFNRGSHLYIVICKSIRVTGFLYKDH